MISIRKDGFRRLHRLGQCRLVPGIDYLHFEELGTDLPEAGLYDCYCCWCWRAPGSGPGLSAIPSSAVPAGCAGAEEDSAVDDDASDI